MASGNAKVIARVRPLHPRASTTQTPQNAEVARKRKPRLSDAVRVSRNESKMAIHPALLFALSLCTYALMANQRGYRCLLVETALQQQLGKSV